MLSISQTEALELIRSNDIKFVRLAFCDIYGNQKNLSIQSTELERAFKSGISMDGSAIAGFSDSANSDLLLFPDPDTLVLLPWRPSRGGVARFFCDIRMPDGKPFVGDTRRYLANTDLLCRNSGLECAIGAECEFYLFRCDDDGNPTYEPLDHAGYFDIAPADRGENVRREICMTLESMGLMPERSHHEQGPGQMEVDFRYSDPVRAADNVITFKQVVSTIAARNGLWASFSPKPFKEHAGNGFHINVSINNVGMQNQQERFNTFMAGLLHYTPDMAVILNPVDESYARLGREKAPNRVSWSPNNRSQLIRIPASLPENQRMELRSPDPLANPYLAFALVLRAGLEGYVNHMTLPEPCSENLLLAPKEIQQQYPALPQTLRDAKRIAAESSFMQEALPAHILNAYTSGL